MSSAVTTISDLADELEDPGVVSSIQRHVADGCPLAPLVEAVTPDWDPADRPRLIAAMVSRAREVIAHQNEHAENDADSGFLHSEEKPSKGGRPKSPERAVRKMAAKLAGVSEETVRRHQKAAEPPAEPLVPPLPKPPGIQKRLGDAFRLIGEALEKAEIVLKDMEQLRDGFGAEDGRHAVIGYVAEATRLARHASSSLAQARDFIDKMNAAKYGPPTGAKKPPAPVKPWQVKEGKRLYEGAKSEAAEQKPLGLTDPPKTGLRAPKKLDARLSDGAGGEVPLAAVEETASAWADAARVGVGPSEDEGNW